MKTLISALCIISIICLCSCDSKKKEMRNLERALWFTVNIIQDDNSGASKLSLTDDQGAEFENILADTSLKLKAGDKFKADFNYDLAEDAFKILPESFYFVKTYIVTKVLAFEDGFPVFNLKDSATLQNYDSISSASYDTSKTIVEGDKLFGDLTVNSKSIYIIKLNGAYY